MTAQIIGMHEWLDTPPGQYLLAWERERMELAVVNMFGYHALQLGFPALAALESNRMPHRWLAVQNLEDLKLAAQSALVADFSALPFPANSLDLVVMPHALELTADPHGALREVARVLVPEGKVIICGLNPFSLWGFRQSREHWYRWLGRERLFLPTAGEFIGYLRLRDWLRLLNLDLQEGRFGCWRPALTSQRWLQRFSWMDKAGARWWPILGSAYFVIAVKRVHGMTLISPVKSSMRMRAIAPVTVASRSADSGVLDGRDQ